MTSPIPPISNAGSSAPFSNAVAGGAMGKDEFVKLLVAQMTHQDPLNPLDGQEMAAQLAQFSSVEQLMNIGQKLDAQMAGNAALLSIANNSAAMNLIGRDITVVTDQINVGPNGVDNVSVNVPAAGGQLSVRITTASGHEVTSQNLGYASGGDRTIDLADMVDGLEPGTYNIEVNVSSGGEVTSLPVRMVVTADGVRFGSDGTVVTSGSLSFPIGTIISITAAH